MLIDFKSPQFLPTSNFKAGEKTNLIGLSVDELTAEMLKIGEKPFKAKQIWNWIYAAGIKDFEVMSNISKTTREQLAQHYSIARPAISQDLLSTDGTRKWLIKFSDCREAEMVFIPEEDRGTLCISSQIGCTLTCKFCHTGTQMLVRNLSAGEIVAQLMLARDLLNDWSDADGRQITSMVFMGMGEPLFNYDQVKKAVEILNDSNGINFSKRKITISTSGVVPEILKFSDQIKTVLAISLHATNDETRSKIMPLNKKYPLKELMQACEYYVKTNPSGRITFEYVMLAGVNDADEDALNLVRLLKAHKLPALINLIPFNPWTGSEFICSSRNRIMAFGNIIKKAGYTVTIRKTRGQDVMAACGQLKSASQRSVNKNHI
ncbi:MAG: 23S rRNA (adenine(2503)-C(2))-methyltransferase RlmN [Pseudomonadota bacterium]